MPKTTVTGSPNIAELDIKITADLIDGYFYANLDPSVFIGDGALSVQGANLKITNPYNVVVKNHPTSGFDISATGEVAFLIPTQANNYQYGTYTFEFTVTDEDWKVYVVSKKITFCAPNSQNKTSKYGQLNAYINGSCKDGKVRITTDQFPTYSGVMHSFTDGGSLSLEYPTGSGLDPLVTPILNFSVLLFQGVYKLTGTYNVFYDLGDNVFVGVMYKMKVEKNVRCLLDETCVYAKLAQLDEQYRSDCTAAEKADTLNIIVNTLRLLKTIEIAASNGSDASAYIDELEDLLGCVCTCNCADGVPIINNAPGKDFLITGCNVTKTTGGLTDSYVINNYSYLLTVTPNGGVLQVTDVTLNGCVQTQNITFNLPTLYTQIKGQISTSTEYNFWASVIKNALSGLDGACLGLTSGQINALTFKQLIQAILSEQCDGGGCAATISLGAVSNTGSDVILSWNNVSGVYEAAVYVDDILKGTVLHPGASFSVAGIADGNPHTYKIIAKCNNGSIGNVVSGAFTYYGCPAIAVPVVSSSSIADAACPYNLTALLSALPPGITAEWHTQNNTSAASLLANPAAAIDGVYYVFAKNADGCYSTGVKVTLVCSVGTNCSAPQTTLVEAITGGNRVRFQSAAFPPPLNSYTVKRRLSADPDISGSYTTIGTPVWNVGANRWEILDASAVANTLYVYRAISNCGATAPYQDYSFANLSCPVVTLTPVELEVGYSFSGVGGAVDKYEVSIYESDAATLVHKDTITPPFGSPVVGTFVYLEAGATYYVRVRVYIGTYYKDCPLQSFVTAGENIVVENLVAGMSIDMVELQAAPGPFFMVSSGALPLATAGVMVGVHSGASGQVQLLVSGTFAASCAILYVDGVFRFSLPISGAGTYTFTTDTYLSTEHITITVDEGACV